MEKIYKALRHIKYRKMILYPPALLYVVSAIVLYFMEIFDIKYEYISCLYLICLFGSLLSLISAAMIYMSDIYEYKNIKT